MRKNRVAEIAGVLPEAVQPVSVEQVRQALADTLPAIVLDVATQEPAYYWQAGGDYYLDDVQFGDVVKIADLDYDSTFGLHPRGR